MTYINSNNEPDYTYVNPDQMVNAAINSMKQISARLTAANDAAGAAQCDAMIVTLTALLVG